MLPPDGKRAFCFYPMSKRRGDGHNWYALDYEERKELMSARRLGPDVRGPGLQLITGSTGLDDWEWGVTLFGVHPDDLKECVYTMRFDEASAPYAEFGPFSRVVARSSEVLDRSWSMPCSRGARRSDGRTCRLLRARRCPSSAGVVVAFSGGATPLFWPGWPTTPWAPSASSA